MVNCALRTILFIGSTMLVIACTLAASTAATFRAEADFATQGRRDFSAKALTILPVQMSSPAPPAAGSSGWQLVRTPGPDKSGDTVSMMRTVDLLNSDPDFAGMAIRCQEKARPQIAFVVIEPFKPRSKATVTVATGPGSSRFDGIVIGPGSMVALPDEAASLLRGWQTAKTLKVEIAGEDLTIKGAVPLVGLAEALNKLETSCPR